MKKWMKVIIGVIGCIILLFAIDLICIFTINRPLLAVKLRTPYTYSGLLYNTYTCPEYSVPQIKAKGTKFSCAIKKEDNGKVAELVDKSKELKDFACAEALESFYEDDTYIYFWNCMKNEYMIVRYENGFEQTISNALENGTITINDLDRYNIDYIKENK